MLCVARRSRSRGHVGTRLGEGPAEPHFSSSLGHTGTGGLEVTSPALDEAGASFPPEVGGWFPLSCTCDHETPVPD